MQTEGDVHFQEDIPSLEELDIWFGPSGRDILVLDSLMDEEKETSVCRTCLPPILS